MDEERSNINAIQNGDPSLPNDDDVQDAELRSPVDETQQDESELFSVRRPLVVSPQKIYSSLEYLTSLSLLGIFSFFGTLIRLGLIAIGSYNGQTVFPLLWAQMMGCCLMGMFTVRKRCIEEIYIPLYVGLTTGLCGSITSFSSWMGDIFQAFARIGKPTHGGFYNFMDGLGLSLVTLAASSAAFVLGTQVGPLILHHRILHFIARWVRLNRYGRFSTGNQESQRTGSTRGGGGQLENGNVNAGAISMGNLNGGIRNGHASNDHRSADGSPQLDNGSARSANSNITGSTANHTTHASTTQRQSNAQSNTKKQSDSHIKPDTSDADSILHTISVEDLQSNYPAWLQFQFCTLFILMWLATILISIYVAKWRGIVSFALVFSPIGVWLRFNLSRFNLRYPSFPLGTFLANMLGTAILALLIVLQYTPNRDLLQCHVMQGIGDGLCGTLTTVSTFIVEIKKLERKHAYSYAVGSWIIGQLLMLVIVGSVDFARRDGLLDSKCAIT